MIDLTKKVRARNPTHRCSCIWCLKIDEIPPDLHTHISEKVGLPARRNHVARLIEAEVSNEPEAVS